MVDVAQAKGIRNMVGLQARANPGILYALNALAELKEWLVTPTSRVLPDHSLDEGAIRRRRAASDS